MERLPREIFVALLGAVLLLPARCQAQGYTITTEAGGGNPASGNGDGGQATSATVANPYDVTVDAQGNVYIADVSRIRKVAPDGTITSVAGGGSPADGVGDNGPATQAAIQAVAVAIDKAGNLYISDAPTGHSRIRKVDTHGIITTVAGTGTLGFSGDGGLATSATIEEVEGLAVDSAGNLYLADTANNRIRKVWTNGIITTMAGGGSPASGIGDGGLATSARLSSPRGIAFDAAGNLYIADQGNGRVRMVSTDEKITTVAGNGSAAYSGDGGPATSAGIDSLWHVAVDNSGHLFLTEREDPLAAGTGDYVRMVAGGVITTIAGNGKPVTSETGDGGPATSAALGLPEGIAVSGNGLIYFTELFNHRVRRLTPVLPPTPAIGAVTNAASFVAGSMVPGEIATLFGTNLMSVKGINLTSTLPLPTEFLNVAVKINGEAVPLFAVDDVNGQQQINFQVPFELVPGTMAMVEVSNYDAVSGVLGVPVVDAQPAVFSYSAGGNIFGAILHANYQTVDTAHPARPGETVLIYCNGLGAVNSPPADGAASSGQHTTNLPVVTIGGITANVSFSGLAPTLVGLNQINVEIPENVPSGNQKVIVTVGNIASPPVLLPIQ